MRKILVLGVNCFSGQDFADLLLDDPENEVIGVSRSPERSATFLRYRHRDDLSRFRYVQLDMNRQADKLQALCDDVEPAFVVNFAALSEVAVSWQHPDDYLRTNGVALATLVNHLARRDYVERYLHISSPEVYGTCVGTVTEDAPLNPSTPYAVSKATADLLLETYRRQFDFPLVTVRATNVYGARQQLYKIAPRTVILLRAGRRIPLHGGGVAVKSYIHIRDVSRGELSALLGGAVGATYHLSPDSSVAIRDLVRTICERMGRAFDESVDIVDERPGQDAAYVIDSSRARAELSWKPEIALDEGLGEVITWVESAWDEIQQLPWEYEHLA